MKAITEKTFLFLCILCTIWKLMTFCSSKSEYIEVCYYDYGMETSRSIPPDVFKEEFNHCKTESIYISKEIFDSIWNGFKATKIKSAGEWDTRFWIKLGEEQYFMDYFFDVYKENYDSVTISHRTAYLIRKSLGCYNVLPFEDLSSVSDIKEFGIPKDYHYSVPESPDPLPGEPPRQPLDLPTCKKVRLFKQE